MITAAHPLSVEFDAAEHDETPRYTIEIEQYSPDYAILRASGDLDMSARATLVDHLDALLTSEADVVVDLSSVSFMYSGAAAAVADAASATSRRVQVFAPTRPVQMILEVLGAGDLIVDSLPARKPAA